MMHVPPRSDVGVLWRLRVPRARGGDCARSFRSGRFQLHRSAVFCRFGFVFVNAVDVRLPHRTPDETVVWRYKFTSPTYLLDFACAFSASATRAAFSRSASLRDPK